MSNIILTLDANGQIAIPQQVRAHLGLAAGDSLHLSCATNGRIVLKTRSAFEVPTEDAGSADYMAGLVDCY